MPGKSAFIYHPIYEDRGLSPFPSVWQRYSLTKELLQRLHIIPERVDVVEPETAGEALLALAHAPSYVEFVKHKSLQGTGFLDYGDTPAYPGVYERATASAGGSMTGADLVGRGEYSHVFNPGGGLHHARYDRAGGFCVFNDIALSARILSTRHGFERIAIVDIDGHHADGTQEYFYQEKVLTVSLHRFDPLFYPGSGDVGELGEGEGYGYTVNLPLPARTPGGLYLEAFNAIVPPVLAWYEPQVIIVQCGVDGHYQDPLVRLYLTTRTYEEIGKALHGLTHELSGGKLLLLGGGGYSPENVARCWTVIFAAVSEQVPVDKLGLYNSIHDRDIQYPVSSLAGQVRGKVEELKQSLTEIHGNIF